MWFKPLLEMLHVSVTSGENRSKHEKLAALFVMLVLLYRMSLLPLLKDFGAICARH